MLDYRPKLMISVLVFNSEGNKMLVGKLFEDGSWGILSGKLVYGENFEECVSRILSNLANILVDDPDRIKFICTFNAVDKENKRHIVSVDYFLQLSKDDHDHILMDKYFFQYWNWFSYEELLKMYDNLQYDLKIFLKKFSITNLEDIKNLVSN